MPPLFCCFWKGRCWWNWKRQSPRHKQTRARRPSSSCFNLILGGGPFISYSKRESYDEYLGTSYISSYEDKNKTVGFGLDIILGVEYDLSENVKLSGEYGVTLSKENSEIENTQTDIYNDGRQNRIRKDEGERNAFITRGLGVNLGLSIFF